MQTTLRVMREADLTERDRAILFERRQSLEEILLSVKSIMRRVRLEGDTALRRFTRRFDGVQLDELQVQPDEFARAASQADREIHMALEELIRAVRAFHEPQVPKSKPKRAETSPGVQAWREWRPIERVGLYVPGGRAPLASSVVMLGIPAAIAGCREIVLCTPPGSDGSVPAPTLLAAEMVGVHRVFKLGGAQAIAAMAYGTESVPRVDKLFGAGNPYVTAAKLLAFPEAALDTPAGPSELCIIATTGANAAWIAADLLSNCEHGPDSPCCLLTPDLDLATMVAFEVDRQLSLLPRQDVARMSVEKWGLIVVTETLDAAAVLADCYAPEHLEIITPHPREILAKINNFGSAFLGPYAPNAAGDFATGTNHVLPTARYARTFAPVSVESFGRLVQCQELTRDGLHGLQATVDHLARAEGLEGHARAVDIRFRDERA